MKGFHGLLDRGGVPGVYARIKARDVTGVPQQKAVGGPHIGVHIIVEFGAWLHPLAYFRAGVEDAAGQVPVERRRHYFNSHAGAAVDVNGRLAGLQGVAHRLGLVLIKARHIQPFRHQSAQVGVGRRSFPGRPGRHLVQLLQSAGNVRRVKGVTSPQRIGDFIDGLPVSMLQPNLTFSGRRA